MVIFLIVLLVLGILLEISALYSGLRRIEFTYSPTKDRAEPGEPFALTAQLTNHSLLPATFLRSDISCPKDAQLPEGLEVQVGRYNKTVHSVYRLWGRQRLQRSIQLSLQTRGVHVFGDAGLHRGDFLGFKVISGTYPAHHEVLIYPKALDSAPLREALGTYCGDTIARRHLIRDPIITMGIREYSGREPMKTISWTQSARRGQLMVREFDYTRDLSCTVLLACDGLTPSTIPVLDRCCSIARTVCQELTDRGVNVELYTNAPLWGYSNHGIWSCSASPGNLDDVLVTLARLFAASRCTAQELASICSQAAERTTAFILIAAENSPGIQDALQLLHDTSGLNALLITADDPNL